MKYNITFAYNKKENFFQNLEIEVPEEKITVLCGHNGAGKTTLLKIISGILPSNIQTSANTWLVPSNGGLIQHFSLFDHIRVITNSPNNLYNEAFELFGAEAF